MAAPAGAPMNSYLLSILISGSHMSLAGTTSLVMP